MTRAAPNVIDDATLLHTTQQFIGLPYSTTLQNLQQGFNCWGLARAYLLRVIGQDIQQDCLQQDIHLHINIDDHHALSQIESTLKDSGIFTPIKHPTSFCLVQMTHAVIPHHVGVYVPLNGGLILHTTLGTGSLLQKRHHVRQLGFTISGFYHINLPQGLTL